MIKKISWIRRHKIIGIFLLIIILIVAYVFWPKPKPVISTVTVKPADLVQSLSDSGTLNAKTSASLSPITSGPLVFLGAQVNDAVIKGQTIAILDQRTLQKNLDADLITYSEQRNTFDQTQDNNQDRTPYQALNDAMKRILQNNQYDLNKAVNSVELSDLAKQQSVLTAPIAGILTRADAVSIGTTVSQTTVFTITDPSSLVFDIDVDEADIGKVKVGQPVSVNLDAYPDENLQLTVSRIDFVSHTTTNGGNAFTTEVKLPDNPDNKYRVGMNGNAEITTAKKDNVLSIPLSSVFDTDKVYVQTAKGFEKRTVTLGLQTDTDAEVIHGVSEGDKIAVQPANVPAK